MNKYRKLPFGKYKGEYVYKIILTHIGYIMWLLKILHINLLMKNKKFLMRWLQLH